MLGGRLGDLVGRRRLFLIGLAIFALSSASAGMAQQAGVLVASRFVQGIGAALVSPAALSLVTLLFTRPQERARAMAIWSGLAGVGVALGVVLSGILTDLATWRWIFFINLPVAAFAFLATPDWSPRAGPSSAAGPTSSEPSWSPSACCWSYSDCWRRAIARGSRSPSSAAWGSVFSS